MQCYKCGCKPVESKKAFFPIDPKGKNRRWSCDECMTDEEVSQIPADVNEIVSALQGKNLFENKEIKHYTDSDFVNIDKDELIFQLWRIIDNIDTFGDMAKSDDKAFRAMTEREQKKRWNYASSEYVDHIYTKYYDRSSKNGSPQAIESNESA